MSIFLITAIHLSCLGQIESGANDLAVGKCGEVSRYQIQPIIWRQWTSIEDAKDEKTSTEIAGWIWQSRINSFCNTEHRAPTLQEVYLLWHRPGRVLNPKPLEFERAERFKNLVERKQ